MNDPNPSEVVGAFVPPVSAVWAFSLGLDRAWPLILFGVVVGVMAKAGATLAGGKVFSWRELKIEILFAALTFVVAGVVVEVWSSVIAIRLTPFAVILLAAGLVLGSARVRGVVERFSAGAASLALGQTGSTGGVVLPPSAPGPEASDLIHRLDSEAKP